MEAKTEEVGFLELSFEELLGVTGACEPAWTLNETVSNGHTVIDSKAGDRRVHIDTTQSVSQWNVKAWTLDPKFNFKIQYTFDAPPFFRI